MKLAEIRHTKFFAVILAVALCFASSFMVVQAYLSASATITSTFNLAQPGAFAIYSENEGGQSGSLTFYNMSLNEQARQQIYVGNTYNGKPITAIYRGVCEKMYDGTNNQVPWLSDGYGSKITFVEFAGNIAPVSTERWFSGCSNLASVAGSSNLDFSRATSTKFMFDGCSKLTSLDLKNKNLLLVTNMFGMFQNCSSLETLDISGWQVTTVLTSTDVMFSGCSKLGKLDFSNWVYNQSATHDTMFANCTKLGEVKINKTCSFARRLPSPAGTFYNENGDSFTADGLWYCKETKEAFAPADIPYSRIPNNEVYTYQAIPIHVAYLTVEMTTA